MITTNDKLNSIYQTKLRIKNVIQTESDEFSEYPDLIAAAIGPSGVSYSYLNEKLTYYVEKDELYNSSYATQSYVVDYVNTYAPTPDLSAYVSYSYLESKHYLDSIPNTYATYAAISEMSYATQSYVVDYVAEHGGGGGSTVIDENIIPKEDATYTLGDASHLYSASYTKSTYFTNNTKIVGSSSDITFYTGGLSRLKINNNILRPDRSGVELGTSSNNWASTYTEILYSPSLVLSYSYNSIDNASNTQINFKVNGWNRAKLTNTTFCPSTNNGIKLGDSGSQWSSSYVRDLYLNGTNIKTAINGMFSYDSSTGTLTITTLS